MSILIIENGYCCGHGDIVHRLENYCLSKHIEYTKKDTEGRSYATLGDKKVELKPTIALHQILQNLGLDQPQQQVELHGEHENE